MKKRTPDSSRPADVMSTRDSIDAVAGDLQAQRVAQASRRSAAAASQSRRARRRIAAATLAISTLLGITVYSVVRGQVEPPAPARDETSHSMPAVAQATPAAPAAAAPVAAPQPTPPAVQPSAQPAAAPSAPATAPAANTESGSVLPATGATGPAELPTTGPSTLPSKFIFRFKNASIDTVLEHLSKVAGFIIVEDVPVEGRITIMAEHEVTASEAVALLDSVLKNSGNTAIPEGRVLKITSRAKAMTMALPVHQGTRPEDVPETDEIVTWVIPLKSVDAVKLKTDLAPLISPDATITSNAASNALIVTDTSANIHRLVQVIHDLDAVPSESSDIQVITLKFADATTTAKLLTDILAPQQGNQMSPQQAMRMMFMRGRGGQGAGAAEEESGRTGKLVTSADPRTNTIVLAGPADTVKVALDIIKTLDADNTEQVSFFTYDLKNGQAADLQSVINTLFGAANGAAAPSNSVNNGFGTNTSQIGSLTSRGGISGIGGNSGSSSSSGSRAGGSSVNNQIFAQPRTSGSGANAAAPGMQNAAQQLLGQAYVVANIDTNSLLVVTSKKYEERVRKLIETLDRPVAQVLIKCLIAEVTHTNTDNVGVQYSVLNKRANGNGFTVGSNFGLQGVSATGGLVGSVVEGDFNLVLQALASTDKLDVLSRPYILATDNQLSSIIVGQDVPIITNVSFTDAGQEINSVQYQQIGIIVNVTPHINPEGLVIMDVAPQVTEIDSQSVTLSPGVASPIFDTRALQGRVGIRDGETIVIGGLMQDQNTTTINKIPILGDIPGLGALFRNTSVTKSKTELLVFLTPHVALKPENLQAMTQKEMQTMMLTPTAVQPGAFEKQLRAMQIGSTQPTTQPLLLPSEMPQPLTPGTIIGSSPRLPGTPSGATPPPPAP